MNESKEQKNKALVLEAFDTLFNRGDYETAERYWSPDYVQRSAYIVPGFMPPTGRNNFVGE
jgi:predicted SnoaL-like aldol condensation-catalyzing enzyme